jgi:TPR repeat protein
MSQSYEAFGVLIREAENGNSQAQCAVGDIYADEMRDVFDVEKAIYWYRKAAEQGHTKAQWLLGASYAQGIGTLKDLTEAELWLLKSAGSGDADGQYTLAGYYMMMKPDIVKAKYWIEKAVEQGHEEAKIMLPAIDQLLEI